MEQNFNGYRVMAHCRGGDEFVHMAHNARLWNVILSEEHIDPKGFHKTIVDMGSVKNAYKFLFDEARKEYNKKVRKCKRIEDYHELVRNDSRRGKHKNQNADGSRKDAYEMILQIGNRDEHPDDELCAKILEKFTTEWWTKHYPNAFIIQNTLHGDEFSLDGDGNKIPSPVHGHIDFVFVAHALSADEVTREREYRAKIKEVLKKQCEERGEKWNEKKWQNKDWQKELVDRYGKSLMSGMSLQSSMTAALAEMGFFTQRGKGTAQQQWEEQVRHDLQNFAEREFGVKIDRSLGRKHSHQEKDLFQKQRDNERKETELSEKENSLNVQKTQAEQKESDLKNRENTINATETQQELKQAELDKLQQSLDLQKNELDYKMKEHDEKFEEQKKFMDSYEQLVTSGRKRIFSIDGAEKEFFDKTSKISLGERVKKFVDICKNAVVDVIIELEHYKRAFKNFWKATPSFFRKLADDMESNSCPTFQDYEKKQDAGQLISQIAIKKRNRDGYEAKKSQIMGQAK